MLYSDKEKHEQYILRQSMGFTITSSTEGAAHIEEDKKSFLAIATGLKSKAFIGIKTTQLRSLPGLIAGNEKTEEWRIEGAAEIDGELFFYGPYLEGSCLSEKSLNTEIIAELLTAFKMIKDRDFPMEDFSLSSVFRTDDGRILLFPPLLMNFLNSRRPEKNSLEMIAPWNHPDLEGEEARVFSLAAIAYKTIFGTPAFSGGNKEEIQRSMRKKDYAPLLLKDPALDKRIIRLIDDSFNGRSSLDVWNKTAPLLHSENRHDKSLSRQDLAAISAETEKKEKKRLKKQKNRLFINRNRTKLMMGAGGAILLALLIRTPLTNVLSPPATIGMSRKEVIQLYYDSYNNLDFENMEACIISKAGKDDINQVTTLYVTTRAQTAYGGSSGLLPAQEWKADGQQPVPPGTFIWGLTDINIEETTSNSFEINYKKWITSDTEEIEDSSPESILMTDIVHLSIINKAWKIDSLRRTIAGKTE